LFNFCNFILVSSVVKLCSLLYLSHSWTRIRVAKVRWLRFYPVKSCGGFNVEQLECQVGGCVYRSVKDRQFMLINNDGMLVTGRTRPRMMLISPQITDGHLALDAPNMATFCLKLPVEGKTLTPGRVSVGLRNVTGVDCGDAVAQWLSEFLETPGLRMLCQTQLCQDDGNNIHYQDESAVSLVSEQSISDVNTKLNDPVTTTNFRSNIIVTAEKPYVEDKWINVFVNNVWFQRMFHTERCLMTTIDPETGVKHNEQQPLATLRTFRILPGYKKPCMAISLAVLNNGTVTVGDDVFITEQ